MTSYTKKLYVRNPQAAKLVAQSQRFEHRLVYGKTTQLAQFTPAWNAVAKSFGKRISPPTAAHACRELCGHPACKHGCVLFRTQDQF
jgi:hypothetical protein